MSTKFSPTIQRRPYHVIILVAGICLLSFSSAEAITYTVTNTNDTGGGSLRQAIIDANTNPGTDIIAFNIAGAGVHTITPASALPTVTSPVTINGTSQPGYSGTPLIELNGASAGSGVRCIDITAGSSTVKGLAINRFTGGGAAGIYISGSGGNIITRNHIGMDTAGTTVLPNTRGVVIYDCPDNDIGGTGGSGTRNIISGNSVDGVQIRESGSSGNRVLGNYIGTDINGTSDRGNDLNGVVILNASNNTVGGNGLYYRNILSGNGTNGVAISGGGSNLVRFNIIGLNAPGNSRLGNDQYGIYILNSSGNTIGGGSTGFGNIVCDNHTGIKLSGTSSSGNILHGNHIGTDYNGLTPLGNDYFGIHIEDAPNNTIGGTTPAPRNLVTDNGYFSGSGPGIEITGSGATGNQIMGNYIGLASNGTTDRGNAGSGIDIMDGASSNTIGGNVSGAGNVISANDGSGIYLTGSGTDSNVIQGNIIGLIADGTDTLGNSTYGISMWGSLSDNQIGGTSSYARNVISGNHGPGIYCNGPDGTLIQGNYIGLDISGTQDFGNLNEGILISYTSNTTIGGSTSGAGNVISGNDDDGIQAWPDADDTVIKGNKIGTNAAGNAPIGNNRAGIDFSTWMENMTIGGTGTYEGNIIAGSGMSGIIAGTDVSNLIIQGNYIGTNASDSHILGNTQDGIHITLGGGSTIGGTAPGAGNVIAHNGQCGVEVYYGAQHTISCNSIYANGELGIDLADDGVTPNDVGDGDAGQNDLMNFPVIDSLIVNGGTTEVYGSLNTLPNLTVRLEFFRSQNADASYHGEGQIFLHGETVVTDGSGNVTFLVTIPSAVPTAEFVTATATASNGSTSEFSEVAYRLGDFVLDVIDNSGQTQLSWNIVEDAAEYWIYGAANNWYFSPGLTPGYAYRQAVIPAGTYTWSTSTGVDDPDNNWSYQIIAMGAGAYELGRSNRAGEFDFDMP